MPVPGAAAGRPGQRPGGGDDPLAAIMFTDIVSYTALMARDEEAGRRARTRHEAVVRPFVERYHGQWIERFVGPK